MVNILSVCNTHVSAETDTGLLPCSKVFMTEQYSVSLPFAADVALLSIYSGSKGQLSSLLNDKNKLRNVALDARGGKAVLLFSFHHCMSPARSGWESASSPALANCSKRKMIIWPSL